MDSKKAVSGSKTTRVIQNIIDLSY